MRIKEELQVTSAQCDKKKERLLLGNLFFCKND